MKIVSPEYVKREAILKWWTSPNILEKPLLEILREIDSLIINVEYNYFQFTITYNNRCDKYRIIGWGGKTTIHKVYENI